MTVNLPELRKRIAEGAYYSTNGEQVPWEDASQEVRDSFVQVGYDIAPFVLIALRKENR